MPSQAFLKQIGIKPTLADLFADAPACEAKPEPEPPAPGPKPAEALPNPAVVAPEALARFKAAYERHTAALVESHDVGERLHAANERRTQAQAEIDALQTKLLVEEARIPKGEAYCKRLEAQMIELKRAIVNGRGSEQKVRLAELAKVERAFVDGEKLLAEVKANVERLRAEVQRLAAESVEALTQGHAAEARLTELEQVVDAEAVVMSDAEVEIVKATGVEGTLCPGCWQLVSGLRDHGPDCWIVRWGNRSESLEKQGKEVSRA